jgi:regulation of enolase protein 1 (concanavalin A-like superfamily)
MIRDYQAIGCTWFLRGHQRKIPTYGQHKGVKLIGTLDYETGRSFIVKTEFESNHRFDQCGVVMYLDSENWFKCSIEYENEDFQHLGSVVTNSGYSDWATTVIDASIKSMWYRFSRREDDYCIESSIDGIHYSQMRIFHMWKGNGAIQFGIYACSPENSSFKATFTNMEITDCKWLAHDGQASDGNV